jgi:integrase
MTRAAAVLPLSPAPNNKERQGGALDAHARRTGAALLRRALSIPTMAKPKKDTPKPLRGSVECRNGVYSLRVRIDGQQKRIPLGSGMSEATVREHFEAWTSGELYKNHGPVNGLRAKKSADVDAWRARRHIYPVIGDKPTAEVSELDIEKVMAAIPGERAGTRVKVYALLSRGFDLAIMPARLRKDSPVTRYHRPPRVAPKLFAYLFPEELLAVLRCRDVPLGRRVLYALAVYSGLRKSSLYALTWAGVDLANGTLFSQVSKTGIAQLFEIPSGLVWVLGRWRAHLGDPVDSAPVVQKLKIERGKGGEAQALREDLRAAGVTRAALFEDSHNVEPLRFHDLRATFVTWAKRAGKGDGFIADRTGHMTAEMISRYTRAARTLADLRIEPFPELEGTIPELGEESGEEPPSGARLGAAEHVPGGVPIAHLRVANGLDRTPQIPENCSTSLPLNPGSGSSGVTLVGVQVPLFAPVGNHKKNGAEKPSAGGVETRGLVQCWIQVRPP